MSEHLKKKKKTRAGEQCEMNKRLAKNRFALADANLHVSASLQVLPGMPLKGFIL